LTMEGVCRTVRPDVRDDIPEDTFHIFLDILRAFECARFPDQLVERCTSATLSGDMPCIGQFSSLLVSGAYTISVVRYSDIVPIVGVPPALQHIDAWCAKKIPHTKMSATDVLLGFLSGAFDPSKRGPLCNDNDLQMKLRQHVSPPIPAVGWKKKRAKMIVDNALANRRKRPRLACAGEEVVDERNIFQFN